MEQQDTGKEGKSLKYLLAALYLVAAFAFGFLAKEPAERIFLQQQQAAQASLDFSYLDEVLTKLEGNFVNPQDIDQNKLIYGAARGMVEASGDAYTTFFDPDETKSFQEDIAGSFDGVGMQVEVKNERLTVVAPIKDTPAWKGGILAGDQVLKVNGTSTIGMSANKAVTLIKGPKGTEVILTIFREGWKETKDFKLVRDTINLPSVELEYKEINGKKIAHLTILQFSDVVYNDFQKSAQDISNNKVQGIILDLRNNPGGLVNQAQNIAGWFLDKNSIILKEKLRSGDIKEYKSNGPSYFSSIPVAILSNKGSASASEILMAALHDNRNIAIIGETSFGKGSVQQLFDLYDGSSIKITIAKWLTPEGKAIDGQGIKPDLEVKMTADDYEQKKDPQMDKAMEIISSEI
ncbi:MAG: S41 family peptidase [Candidatus Paceibacterota bacterium]|jgi:carboxyl-terminal processing protease